jgi:tryptophanyl-tRNA synthetase
MSLKDASRKMSKSDTSAQASVLLMDDADAIARKIKRATTDPEPLPSEEKGLEGRAEADNLVGIYAALAGTSKAEVLKQFGGQGWGVFKPALAELAVNELAPVAAEIRRMLADPAYIDGFMADGAARASIMAEATMTEVRRIVGFLR